MTRPPIDRAGAPLVSMRGLEVDYVTRGVAFARGKRTIRAVAGVDLDIWPGETVGLVGESGCGKSTLARAALRLVEPTAGSVRFAGADVGALEGDALRALRRRAQLVFQDPFGSLNPRMTVAGMLDEALLVHGLGGADRRGRVGELLELVGLGAEHADRYPHEFSGGQRQRIGIARSLSVEPDLLILDEPVSALDVSVQAQVVNLLVDLQQELGLTYLFIAHDLSLVRHVSDRVAVMYLGRLVEVAEAKDLYENPSHPYTQALLSAVPRPDPRGRDSRRRIVLEGDVPDPADQPPGCPFYARCHDTRKDLDCQAYVPALESDEGRHWVACHKVGWGAESGVDTPSGPDHNPTLP